MRHGRLRRVLAVVSLLLAPATVASALPLVYVPNYGDGTVSIIDGATNTVVTTPPVGSQALGVAVSPGGALAFVTREVVAGTVSIIDGTTHTVIGSVPVGSRPTGIAVKLPGDRVYVANRDDKTVTAIDPATGTIVKTVAVGFNPLGVAVNPAGTPAYVVNKGSDDVTVIDTTTNAVIDTIPVGNDPTHIAVSPNGGTIYVSNGSNSAVSVIDTATNREVTTIGVGNSPEGVAFDPTGTRAYVANNGPGSVSVIDVASHSVLTTVDVGVNPFELTVDASGAHVYVTNRGGTSVSVIDTATNTVETSVDVGFGPAGFGTLTMPGLRPPRFAKAVLACQSALATRAQKLASKQQALQVACLTRALKALATGQGPSQVDDVCAPEIDLTNPGSPLSLARQATVAAIFKKCAQVTPLELNRPCDRSAGSMAATVDCVLARHHERVRQMIDAAFALDAPVALAKGPLACQTTLAASARKFADTVHTRLVACVTRALKAAAVSRGGAGVAACFARVDPASAASRLAAARRGAEARILRRCADVLPADLGHPCDAGATTMTQVADCVLDRHASRVEKMVAAEFNDVCPILTTYGVAPSLPDVCTGP